MHQRMALLSFGQNINPFAAAVCFIGAKDNEFLLFQTGQKPGNGGVAQPEGFLDIPGAGRGFAVGKVAHDVALGCGKLHGCQRVGHGLVSAAVEDTEQMTVMYGQEDHLQTKCSKLPISLAQRRERCKGESRKICFLLHAAVQLLRDWKVEVKG